MRRTRQVPRVLFVGSLWAGSNAASYWKAFVRLSEECIAFDTSHVCGAPGTSFPSRVGRRINGAIRTEPTVKKARSDLIQLARQFKPDVIFAVKALWLDATTVNALTARTKVHFHPDDTANHEETTPAFFEAEALWNLHVTSRQCNVIEALARGAQDALRVPFAYDRDLHQPVQTERLFATAFVGTRRPDRTATIERVAERYGQGFLVCGANWNRARHLARAATLRPPAYGLAMSEALCSSATALGFLNSGNRDQHSYRSLEIPACGGLLVAERTQEHQEMFEDGREALLFSSEEELFSHVDRARADSLWANSVAAAGRRRVIGDGNTFEHRVAYILEYLGYMPNDRPRT